MKIVNTREYIALLKELIEEGKPVGMLVTGNSMSPFLVGGRDSVFLEKRSSALHVGDIVFFQRNNGQYVMHRICKIRPEGFYLVGDAQTEIEGPIVDSQIFAVITMVKRKNVRMSKGCFWWEFFEHVWICIIPLRPALRAILGRLNKLRRRDEDAARIAE